MSASSLLGLDAARAANPAAYAISGRPPRSAVRPASREELAECLRAASRERLAVVPWGGGTSLSHDSPPERYDVALDLRALDRLVEYDPEDMTLTAECGITLAKLRATLAARGQELPLEGAAAERATLGGLLASNASGARRLRFGAPRDRILGASFALSDGTLARSGGKVVKNVAGFALHRLLCGSRGALAAFVEASLKLAPAPAARRALIYDVTAKALRDAARWSFLPRLEPAAVTVVGADAGARAPALTAGPNFTVVVVLEDETAWVERQEAAAVATLGAPRSKLEGADVGTLLQALCDAVEQMPRRAGLTTAWNSPAALGVILDRPAAARRVVFHVLAGRLHLELDSESSAVHRLAGPEFSLVEARGIGPLEPSLPPFAVLKDLRSRIRSGLDPSGVWGYGPRWEAPV